MTENTLSVRDRAMMAYGEQLAEEARAEAERREAARQRAEAHRAALRTKLGERLSHLLAETVTVPDDADHHDFAYGGVRFRLDDLSRGTLFALDPTEDGALRISHHLYDLATLGEFLSGTCQFKTEWPDDTTPL